MALLDADDLWDSTFLDEQKKPTPKEWQLGLRSHIADPQYKYLATHPKIAGIAAQNAAGSGPFLYWCVELSKLLC